jgi:hypothetical protein
VHYLLPKNLHIQTCFQKRQRQIKNPLPPLVTITERPVQKTDKADSSPGTTGYQVVPVSPWWTRHGDFGTLASAEQDGENETHVENVFNNAYTLQN